MALLSVVRHWHFLDQLSIQEISRRIGLTRNTKRKYLRTDTVEPAFKVPARTRKLDTLADKLSDCLRTGATKSRNPETTELPEDLVSQGSHFQSSGQRPFRRSCGNRSDGLPRRNGQARLLPEKLVVSSYFQKSPQPRVTNCNMAMKSPSLTSI